MQLLHYLFKCLYLNLQVFFSFALLILSTILLDGVIKWLSGDKLPAGVKQWQSFLLSLFGVQRVWYNDRVDLLFLVFIKVHNCNMVIMGFLWWNQRWFNAKTAQKDRKYNLGLLKLYLPVEVSCSISNIFTLPLMWKNSLCISVHF